MPGQVERRYSIVDILGNEASSIPRVKSSEPFGSAFSTSVLPFLVFCNRGCVPIHSSLTSAGQPIISIIALPGGVADSRGTYWQLLYDSQRKIAISLQYLPPRGYKDSTRVHRCRGIFSLPTSSTSIWEIPGSVIHHWVQVLSKSA